MDNQSFENRMRELEYFHHLRLLPGAWVVVRVEGRSFSRFTERRISGIHCSIPLIGVYRYGYN